MTRKSKLRDEADRLFSLHIRQVGFCHRCGSTRNLQCAHIMPRKYTATRCDPLNAVCLCLECHGRFTNHPDKWTAYCIERVLGADAYDDLREKSQRVTPNTVDWWETQIRRLKKA